MPFDANGKHTLPPIYKAKTGETILAEQHNVPLEDISQGLSEVIKSSGATPFARHQSMGGFRLTDLRNASDQGDAVNKKQLDQAVPIGIVDEFAGDTPPTGWLFCDGKAVSRTTYAALFTVIGTKFGSGDGGATFNLPDYRGRVGVGRDDMGGTAANRVTNTAVGIDASRVGAVGGQQDHKLTEAQIPKHGHSGTAQEAGNHRHNGFTTRSRAAGAGTWAVTSNGADGPVRIEGYTDEGGSHSHTLSISRTGGDQPHSSMQPSIIINYIIRAGV